MTYLACSPKFILEVFNGGEVKAVQDGRSKNYLFFMERTLCTVALSL